MMKENSEYQWGAVLAFAGLHLAALGLIWTPWTWGYVALAAFTYFLRMFGVTAGYHRYFSHRSYRLGRVSQFLMAFLAQTSAQKGALWWAAHHRFTSCRLAVEVFHWMVFQFARVGRSS